MRVLTPELRAESRKILQNDGPWLELWHIEVDTSEASTVVLPIVRHSEEIVFDGVTYYPFPIKRSAISQDKRGSLPTASVALGNISRDAARWEDMGEGFNGRAVEMRKVHVAHLGGSEHAIEFSWTVHSVAISHDSVSLELRN